MIKCKRNCRLKCLNRWRNKGFARASVFYLIRFKRLIHRQFLLFSLLLQMSDYLNLRIQKALLKRALADVNLSRK